MVNGAHVIIYSKDAEADRRFLQNVLRFEHVDVGGGWLIFALPPAEVAVHPTDDAGSHELFFMCDDVEAVAAKLKSLGHACSPVMEQRWGRLINVTMPSGSELGIYQPLHALAHGAVKKTAKKATGRKAAAKRPAGKKAAAKRPAGKKARPKK